MIEFLEGLLRVLGNVPRGVWAVIAGTLFSWGATQRLKFLIPYRYSYRARHQLTQVLAFTLAHAATWTLWPTLEGFVVANLVGLLAPWSYSIFVQIIGVRYPYLRDKLSQDVRP